MKFHTVHTDNQNEDFLRLVVLLDEDLDERYGIIQKNYTHLNKVDGINDVIVVYQDNTPIACGGFKPYEDKTIELKRMFVVKSFRGQGLAKRIINELEQVARSRGYTYSILETGVKQPEAIGLYKSLGYGVIPNYGPYENDDNSICMKKCL